MRPTRRSCLRAIARSPGRILGPAAIVRAGLVPASTMAAARPAGDAHVPILTYHRFGTTAVDSMTVRSTLFDAHLRLLERLDCQIIPLQTWVQWRLGQRLTLPPRAVVLTADDGHRSQHEILLPRLKERGWPATLFIYPSAISNASYAMTWSQLAEAVAMPGVTIESHTFWHPNFAQERRRLAPERFESFATDQLKRSRQILEDRLSQPVTLLAWPFGISDPPLQALAQHGGYVAGFGLGNRSADPDSPLMDVPRHLIVDSVDERELERRLQRAFTRPVIS